jgi:hypothetical protein
MDISNFPEETTPIVTSDRHPSSTDNISRSTDETDSESSQDSDSCPVILDTSVDNGIATTSTAEDNSKNRPASIRSAKADLVRKDLADVSLNDVWVMKGDTVVYYVRHSTLICAFDDRTHFKLEQRGNGWAIHVEKLEMREDVLFGLLDLACRLPDPTLSVHIPPCSILNKNERDFPILFRWAVLTRSSKLTFYLFHCIAGTFADLFDVIFRHSDAVRFIAVRHKEDNTSSLVNDDNPITRYIYDGLGANTWSHRARALLPILRKFCGSALDVLASSMEDSLAFLSSIRQPITCYMVHIKLVIAANFLTQLIAAYIMVCFDPIDRITFPKHGWSLSDTIEMVSIWNRSIQTMDNRPSPIRTSTLPDYGVPNSLSGKSEHVCDICGRNGKDPRCQVCSDAVNKGFIKTDEIPNGLHGWGSVHVKRTPAVASLVVTRLNVFSVRAFKAFMMLYPEMPQDKKPEFTRRCLPASMWEILPHYVLLEITNPLERFTQQEQVVLQDPALLATLFTTIAPLYANLKKKENEVGAKAPVPKKTKSFVAASPLQGDLLVCEAWRNSHQRLVELIKLKYRITIDSNNNNNNNNTNTTTILGEKRKKADSNNESIAAITPAEKQYKM